MYRGLLLIARLGHAAVDCVGGWGVGTVVNGPVLIVADDVRPAAYFIHAVTFPDTLIAGNRACCLTRKEHGSIFVVFEYYIRGVWSQDSFNVLENFRKVVIYFLSTRIIVNKINDTKIN